MIDYILNIFSQPLTYGDFLVFVIVCGCLFDFCSFTLYQELLKELRKEKNYD